jgi:hypothetical protein
MPRPRMVSPAPGRRHAQYCAGSAYRPVEGLFTQQVEAMCSEIIVKSHFSLGICRHLARSIHAPFLVLQKLENAKKLCKKWRKRREIEKEHLIVPS